MRANLGTAVENFNVCDSFNMKMPLQAYIFRWKNKEYAFPYWIVPFAFRCKILVTDKYGRFLFSIFLLNNTFAAHFLRTENTWMISKKRR